MCCKITWLANDLYPITAAIVRDKLRKGISVLWRVDHSDDGSTSSNRHETAVRGEGGELSFVFDRTMGYCYAWG